MPVPAFDQPVVKVSGIGGGGGGIITSGVESPFEQEAKITHIRLSRIIIFIKV
jgi:hypothetical protein